MSAATRPPAPSLPGVNRALADAVRRVNALYEEIPPRYRPDINGMVWQALEAEIAEAVTRGGRSVALQAIEVYREHAEHVLACTLANAPLESPRG